MLHLARLAVAALSLLLSGQVFAAGPQSLIYPTKTDFWGTDIRRMASLAESIDGITGSFALRLFEIAPADCRILGGCPAAAQNYVFKAGNIARELATKLKAIQNLSGPALDTKVAELRISHLDELAMVQWNLRKRFTDDHTLGGDLANYECKDFYELYYMLMTRMVAFPRPVGLGGGAGVDD